LSFINIIDSDWLGFQGFTLAGHLMALFLRTDFYWQEQVSKYQHLPTHMQMLCQSNYVPMPLKRFFATWLTWALNALFLLGCSVGFSEPLTPQALMHAQVTEWAKKIQLFGGASFSFAPMDPRLKVQACERPLDMDMPFASKETVRVRCQTGTPWQLYIRLLPANSLPETTAVKPADAKEISHKQVVVGKLLLRRGTVLTADMLSEIEYSAQGLDPQAVSSIRDLENAEIIRDMPAGTPLRSHDVRRAVLVKQGQSVLLTVTQGNGFSITARVDALQDGKMGEQIRLKNPESGRILSGVVTGPSAAKGI
jgi:flagella basal body P-ring formation protein FlgA